jgi:hypothetical protein
MPGPLEVTDPAEDAQAAQVEAYMRRGEGADETEAGPEEAPEAAPKEFKYRGRTVKVDPETYSLLEDLKREARGANGRLGSELARTRERLAKVEGVLSAYRPATDNELIPEIAPPDPLLATRDIAAWQRQYDAYHTAKMERSQKKIEAEYLEKVRQAEARMADARRETEWAEQFYSSYDHLASPDLKPVVAQVYTEHKSEIDALGDDVASAHERLAELAEARIARLANVGKGRANANNSGRPPHIESAAGPTPRGKQEEKPRDFSAAAWVAKQRLLMSGRTPKKE